MDDSIVEVDLIKRLIEKYKEQGKEDIVKGLEMAVEVIEESGSISYSDYWNMDGEEIDEEILKPIMENCEENGNGYQSANAEHDKIVKAELCKEIMEWIDTDNRGTADYFIVDAIEQICNKYMK